MNEIGNRINSVQKLVSSYRGETENSIGDIKRKMDSFMAKAVISIPTPEIPKEVKQNFIRRIFGN